MKYCPTCGKQLADNAVMCPGCGQQFGGSSVAGKTVDPADASSFGYAVLGFFFPIIGLILFLVWKDQFPLRSKSPGKGALTGVIVNVIVGIIYGVALGLGYTYYY